MEFNQTFIQQVISTNYTIGEILSVQPIEIGLIHKTFAITSVQGQYIMQQLHSVLATPEIADDFFAVTEFLKQQHVLAPVCVLTNDKTVLSKNGPTVWRMQTMCPGITIQKIEQTNVAEEAGKIFGKFHSVMNQLDYQFKSQRTGHDTGAVYTKFLAVVEKFSGGSIAQDVQREISLIQRELPDAFLPNDLPVRVVHGDPKISNILFVDDHASSIIDLDTCQRQSILGELGDAFRSWCGNNEDDPNNTFSLSLFQAAWKGYQTHATFLTKEEKSLLPQAIGTIILELATRFLIDYFEDEYFGWDDKLYESRRAHNLARCRGQLQLFADYQSKIDDIRMIVV